jgi:hypothetical protein
MAELDRRREKARSMGGPAKLESAARGRLNAWSAWTS